MRPNLAILTFQTKTHTGPGTQQNAMLTFQTKTHTGHGTQPCNTCIPKPKHILCMGPNLAILTFQTKTHTRLGTQQNAMLTFQTKTHTKPKTQLCNTYIPKLKHTLDMGPTIIIPIFKTNNYIYTFADLIIFSHNQKNVDYIHMLIHYMKLIEL